MRFPILETERPNLLRCANVFPELGCYHSHVLLQSSRPDQQLFAHVSNGENGDGNDGESPENDDNVRFFDRETDDEYERSEKGGRLFDPLVGNQRKRRLQLVRICHPARNEIAGGTPAEECEGQNLEFREVVSPDFFHEPHDAVGNQIGASEAADSAGQENRRKPERVTEEFPSREDDRRSRRFRRKYPWKNLRDGERQGEPARGAVKKCEQQATDQGPLNSIDQSGVWAKAFHDS